MARLKSNAYADVVALMNGLPTNARRRSVYIAVHRLLRNLEQALINPPGPVNEAIHNFLAAAGHTFENAFDDAIA